MQNQGKTEAQPQTSPVYTASNRASSNSSLGIPANVGMVFQLADGSIQACNPCAEELLGVTAEQMQGCTSINSPWQTVHEDGSPFGGETHPAMVALQTGQPCSDVVMGLSKPNGELIWLKVSANPLFQANESTPFAVVTTFTQSQPQPSPAPKLVEKSTAQQLLATLESISDAFFSLDLDWRLTYVNPQMTRLVNRSSQELIGKNIWEEFPEAAGALFEQEYRRAVAERVTVSFEAFYPPFNVWYAVRAYPMASGLAVYFQDVTEQKNAQAALLQQEQTASERLAEIEAIYATALVGLCFIDTELRYVRINEHMAEIDGVSVEEHLGRTLRDVLPEMADDLEPLYRQLIETGEPIFNLEVSGTNRAQPGVIRDWLVSYYPLKGADNRVQGVNVVVQEITERKRLEQERERLLAEAEAAREAAETANRIKDEFLAVLSHELRSPLNPILGWSKLLQTGRLNASKTAEALKTIERNANLQSQLIEDLLDVSRILQGKFSLNMAPVRLETTIAAALETVRLAAKVKAIQIQISLEPEAFQVSGDAGRLQQIVWNLLSNAVKFTPKGGRVEVRLVRVDDHAQIMVIDTGKGISPDFLPYVFERFRQEDSATTRKFGGLGLGLAIVRQLVELHGGTVWAESAGEDQGATFTVRLPLLKANKQTSNCDRSLPPTIKSLPLVGFKILVVDDEADSRDLIAFVLEQAGAEVIALSSAIEVLQFFQHTQADLLVSDIGMPDMDGYMLLRQVRMLPRQDKQIPAIALTAYAGEYDQKQAITAGFQQHMSKPIDPEKLVQAIAQALTLSGQSPH
jgi:PAS domain S-box-containing protein